MSATSMQKSKSHNNTPQEIWNAITSSKNPICCIDSRFDFDAICSALAVYEILKGEDINLTLTFDGKIREKAKQIFDTSVIKELVDPKSIDFSKHDLLIFLDSGNLEHVSRVDDFAIPEGIKTINIDHHVENPLYGDLVFVMPVSSTGRVLYELFSKLKLKLNEHVRKCLLTSMLSDTGFFQFGYASRDLRIAADLMDSGVDILEIIWQLTFNDSWDDYKYRSIVYKNLKVDLTKGYAYTTMTQKELTDMQIDVVNIGMRASDLIKRLDGVNFVFSVTESEKEPGTFDVSFRSHRLDYEILSYAKILEGGGHRMAAGGKVTNAKDINDVVRRVMAVIES